MLKKIDIGASEIEYIETLNSIVDAVNEFGKDMVFLRRKVLELGYKDPQTRQENVQDKFAEQRKWIGCLVEYGNADDGFRYGILTNIEPQYSAYPFEIDNGRDATADCWLPSKTIFYEGSDK